MSGNRNQYDPTRMFQDWIQKSGQAQAEFVKNFGTLMASTGDQKPDAFNPLGTLRTITENAQNAQSKLMENVSSMQSRGMDALIGMGQNTMIPFVANWGAYKTTIGSNGRISIPEAERNALGIGEGDLVQVIVLPIPNRKKKEVKE